MSELGTYIADQGKRFLDNLPPLDRNTEPVKRFFRRLTADQRITWRGQYHALIERRDHMEQPYRQGLRILEEVILELDQSPKQIS